MPGFLINSLILTCCFYFVRSLSALSTFLPAFSASPSFLHAVVENARTAREKSITSFVFQFIFVSSFNYFLRINQSAWMIPGTQKKIQRIMFMSKSLPIPLWRNTASGGSKIANMIFKMSMYNLLLWLL